MVCDETHIPMLIFAVISGMVLGAAAVNPYLGSPNETTTYTLEDVTVLHDCNKFVDDCGLSFNCKSGDIYQCQKNVKITTEAKSATLNAKNVKTFMEQNGCTALFTQTFPIGNLACQKNECTSGGYCKYTTKNLIE